MKKSNTLLLVGAVAAGAFLLFHGAGSSGAPVDIGEGDYKPSSGGLSFIVNWTDPINLEERSRLLSILSLKSRGISGTYEVLEIDPDVLTGGTVDENSPDWQHVLQGDVLNQIHGFAGDFISFADVYEA